MCNTYEQFKKIRDGVETSERIRQIRSKDDEAAKNQTYDFSINF